VYQTEKFVADNPDSVPAEVKSEVEQDVAALKKALEGEDNDALKSAFDKLSESRTKMGSAIYANAQQAQGTPAGDTGAGAGDASTGGGDDDVVDAEIVDEDKPAGGNEGQGGQK
ncbi:molecular chaperone DnaK, partial [Actinopolymorpha singaporensis]